MSASPSWINVSPPDDQPHNVIAIDPRNMNAVYVGTDAGIWYSVDGGAGWQLFGPNNGLPNAPVYDSKINPRTDRIVAFTYGRGAFLLDANAVPASGRPLAVMGAYSPTLSATPGRPPYTWSVGAGALPPGLTLSARGDISGTPTASGVFTFTVVVRDSSGGIASQTYHVTVPTAVQQ